jgi:dipeptidyl aminopeptidase/acylaminoacyl peptidase
MKPFKIESLLSGRLYFTPQLVGDRLYFLSDMSGRISLYAMHRHGSVPVPLLPQNIALQTPHHIGGESFFVFPKLGKILVMLDRDGDENYQPTFIPIEGGIPEPIFGDRFKNQQTSIAHCDIDRNTCVMGLDPRTNPNIESFLVNLETRELTSLGTSLYGNYPDGVNEDYSKVVLLDSFTSGDHVVYLWEREAGQRRLLYGTPLEARTEGQQVAYNSIQATHFTRGDRGLLFITSLFEDSYGLGYLSLDDPSSVQPVEVVGTVHQGAGEMEGMEDLEGNRYRLNYNIDGVSYAYEGHFDEETLRFQVDAVLCGTGELSNGVLEAIDYDEHTGDYALSFSTATTPSQLYIIEGEAKQVTRVTDERILGVPQELLSPGEDASYTSHDGLRISARLYMPAADLGFEGPRPVLFYIHGGPQGQERPDFTWFSMPLIQFLTLNGFAVFVPNVRGSVGYGLDYMKQVDHDWGGQDRLDHVEAIRQLRDDPRLDVDRVGVMGRSYGGYMTLTLAGRHPELWKAACDMFGPYNLFTFMDRLPEAWKTYFYIAVGHPEHDKEFLTERSPRTYLQDLACPLLVIQGANDPRVVEAESRSVVEELRDQGKTVEYLVFDNEGHDVLKFENKVRCYNEIVRFFKETLQP